VVGNEEVIIDKPMSPAEIREVIYSKVQPHDIVQAVLQQELALYCGKLIVTNPDIFDGILKIRIGWILQAIQLYMDITKENKDDIFKLGWCSPSEVRRLLQIVLDIGEHPDTKDKLTVFQRRQFEGCLCRVPTNFYGKVWHVLRKTPGGIIIAGKTLPQEPTLSHMTLSELNFALQVENMLHNIEHPEYIQIVIELLCVVSTILQRNPELAFTGSLDVDGLVESAYKMFRKDFKAEGKSTESENELYPFFNAPAATTTGYLARAVANNILQGIITVKKLSRKSFSLIYIFFVHRGYAVRS
jgi:phosphorylase kinase alpha/beta subunit